MSMDTSDQNLTNIEDFEHLALTKKLAESVTINWKFILCMGIPYLGQAFDLVGLSSINGMDYVRSYARSLIKSRSEATAGRKSDFLNLMLEQRLSKEEAQIATKV